MKTFSVAVAVAATLAALLWPCASPGDAAAAIGGSVVDAATGHQLAGIAVEVAGQDGREPRMVLTDKHGFFVIFGLDPGRYVVTVRVAAAASCHIEDVASGQMRRVQIVAQANPDICVAGRSAASLVDPDETGNAYRIP